jgi:hypothetical protein
MQRNSDQATTAQTTALLLLYMLSAPMFVTTEGRPIKVGVIQRPDNKPIKRKPEWFVPNQKHTSPAQNKTSRHGGR